MEQSASNTVQQGLTTQSLLPEDQVERKTESMIPLFASIAQRQQEKIDRLNEKISTIESKIERNKTAIDRLQHKSAILRKDADLMRKIAKKLPAFSSALNAMADKKLQNHPGNFCSSECGQGAALQGVLHVTQSHDAECGSAAPGHYAA